MSFYHLNPTSSLIDYADFESRRRVMQQPAWHLWVVPQQSIAPHVIRIDSFQTDSPSGTRRKRKHIYLSLLYPIIRHLDIVPFWVGLLEDKHRSSHYIENWFIRIRAVLVAYFEGFLGKDMGWCLYLVQHTALFIHKRRKSFFCGYSVHLNAGCNAAQTLNTPLWHVFSTMN